MIDVNENFLAPVFDELVYDSYIRENLAPGSKVIQVKAEDHDDGQADSTVEYTITRGSGLGHFTIDKYGNGRLL